METKEQLVSLIREWIESDNKISTYQKTIKEEKQNKKNLTDQLITIMKTHEIECFDVKNGKLIHTKTKSKQSISKKLLLESLTDYFKEDTESASQLTAHILDSRQEKINETIKRRTIQ